MFKLIILGRIDSGDKSVHYWFGAPVWKTLCGVAVSTPYEYVKGDTEYIATCTDGCESGLKRLYELATKDV